jgi:hypothetical protein
VFGERRMGEHAFVEAGADLYFSEAFPFEPAAGEDQMSRLSGLLSVAGGLRMFPRSRVSAYAQIGAGLELTRVAMGTGAEQLTDNRALPTAFVGFGGDLRLSERAVIGMNLRAFAMGHFDHGHGDVVDAGHGDVVDAGHGAGLDVEPEAAAQGQFYLKYSL